MLDMACLLSECLPGILPALYEEYGKYFPADKPARTTVEAMLNSPDLLVEITVTAGMPE
jgi:enamine deaminase RidA (YjgF/YER057c/UK114 family)